MRRAAFLDRDGVINRKAPEGAYVVRWEEMEILPGVAEGISLLNAAGFEVIIVTNQRCVAKGLLSVADLEALHARLCSHLAAKGAGVDAIYFCPHESQPACSCRKPAPGMLLRAAADRNLDLPSSWMIGDSEHDIAAGRAAGCRTARIAAGSGPRGADLVAESLLAAAREISRCEHASKIPSPV